jgi:hypothetical protein
MHQLVIDTGPSCQRFIKFFLTRVSSIARAILTSSIIWSPLNIAAALTSFFIAQPPYTDRLTRAIWMKVRDFLTYADKAAELHGGGNLGVTQRTVLTLGFSSQTPSP